MEKRKYWKIGLFKKEGISYNCQIRGTKVGGKFVHGFALIFITPVEGHIFISILAYHLLHSIEYTLRMNGDRSRWAAVKRLMSNHCYSTIQLPTTQGTVINLRKPGIPEGVHQELYRKLDVELSSLPQTQNLA